MGASDQRRDQIGLQEPPDRLGVVDLDGLAREGRQRHDLAEHPLRGRRDVLEATGGRGADAVIDAVAKDASLDAAFAAARAGGTVSVIGVHDLEPYPLPILMGLLRSITLRMTTAPVHRTWRDLVPLVQHGRLDTSGIFTHEFALDDAAAAYAAVAARTPDCIKVRLHP